MNSFTENKSSSISSVFNILKYFYELYPLTVYLIFFSLLLAGFLEGVGILTILPVLNIIITDSYVANSAVEDYIINFLSILNVDITLISLLSLIVVSICLKSCFAWVAMKYVGDSVAKIQTNLRIELIDKLMLAKWGHFTSIPIGQLTNAISTEAPRAAAAVFNSTNFIVVVIQSSVYLTIATLISPVLTVFAIAAGILLIFIFNIYVKVVKKAGEGQTKYMGDLLARFTDALQGIKAVKAMGRENQLSKLITYETRELNEFLRKEVLGKVAVKTVQEPVLTIILAIGLYVALINYKFPISEVMVMALVFWRSAGMIGSIQKNVQAVVLNESALWSINSKISTAEKAEEIYAGNKVTRLADKISLRDVAFSYNDGKQILTNVNIEIPVNKITAITGVSGVGKSTIADLVTGFYKVSSGTIYVDETNIDDIDIHKWREKIGYVPQDTFLFNDSIFMNVSLNDENISEGDVVESLRLSGAISFVNALENGVYTNIGERGQLLSGGQRQRINIARAIVRKPLLLILDEATTALDPETENEICETLVGLSSKMTVLAISHQPAIIKKAHVVYKVNSGADINLAKVS
jgi:ATP-binding cassette, subfamily C, bacterial